MRSKARDIGGKPGRKYMVEALPSDRTLNQTRLHRRRRRYVLHGLPDGDVIVRVHSFPLEQKAEATAHGGATSA
jgi:hypothetical protein